MVAILISVSVVAGKWEAMVREFTHRILNRLVHILQAIFQMHFQDIDVSVLIRVSLNIVLYDVYKWFVLKLSNHQWMSHSLTYTCGSKPTCVNSLRPRPNIRHFADDIFKCIFENEIEGISPRISLKFVPKVRINNIPALVHIMAWRRSGDEPLSEPVMVSLLTHICVTRPQWVKLVCNWEIIENTNWHLRMRDRLVYFYYLTLKQYIQGLQSVLGQYRWPTKWIYMVQGEHC